MKGKEMKKIHQQTLKKPEICDRVRQIRSILFDENNREFAAQIGENEQVLSAICVGRRPAGMTTIVKIAENLPSINTKWLLTGGGDMIIDRIAKRQNESVEAPKEDSTVIQMLRDMLREKDNQIAELTADNALLKRELRTKLYEKEGGDSRELGTAYFDRDGNLRNLII